ncbi:MAG: hypothetical protein ACK5R0_20780 [Bacteroidota bacterium]
MKKRYWFLSIAVGLAIVAFTPPADRYFEIARNMEIFASLFKVTND